MKIEPEIFSKMPIKNIPIPMHLFLHLKENDERKGLKIIAEKPKKHIKK